MHEQTKKKKPSKTSTLQVNVPTVRFTYIDLPSNHVYNNTAYTDPVTYSFVLDSLKVSEKNDLVSSTSSVTISSIDVLVSFTPTNLPGNSTSLTTFTGNVQSFSVTKTSAALSTQLITFSSFFGAKLSSRLSEFKYILFPELLNPCAISFAASKRRS